MLGVRVNFEDRAFVPAFVFPELRAKINFDSVADLNEIVHNLFLYRTRNPKGLLILRECPIIKKDL